MVYTELAQIIRCDINPRSVEKIRDGGMRQLQKIQMDSHYIYFKPRLTFFLRHIFIAKF